MLYDSSDRTYNSSTTIYDGVVSLELPIVATSAVRIQDYAIHAVRASFSGAAVLSGTANKSHALGASLASTSPVALVLGVDSPEVVAADWTGSGDLSAEVVIEVVTGMLLAGVGSLSASSPAVGVVLVSTLNGTTTFSGVVVRPSYLGASFTSSSALSSGIRIGSLLALTFDGSGALVIDLGMSATLSGTSAMLIHTAEGVRTANRPMRRVRIRR